MAKKKFDLNKVEHETRAKFKRTSISKKKKPKFSSMNKSKKRDFNRINRGGR